jgi:hypothetical protein
MRLPFARREIQPSTGGKAPVSITTLFEATVAIRRSVSIPQKSAFFLGVCELGAGNLISTTVPPGSEKEIATR